MSRVELDKKRKLNKKQSDFGENRPVKIGLGWAYLFVLIYHEEMVAALSDVLDEELRPGSLAVAAVANNQKLTIRF